MALDSITQKSTMHQTYTDTKNLWNTKKNIRTLREIKIQLKFNLKHNWHTRNLADMQTRPWMLRSTWSEAECFESLPSTACQPVEPNSCSTHLHRQNTLSDTLYFYYSNYTRNTHKKCKKAYTKHKRECSKECETKIINITQKCQDSQRYNCRGITSLNAHNNGQTTTLHCTKIVDYSCESMPL